MAASRTSRGPRRRATRATAKTLQGRQHPTATPQQAIIKAMMIPSKQISELIDRPAHEAYAYAADPANLPEWAPGLGTAVEQVDGRWWVETSVGRVEVEFAPVNAFGVLDHHVTFPSGEVFYNPMRVFPNEEGCEVVFTLRRTAGMTDEEFARDAGLVQADLTRLKQVLEDED